MKINLQLCLMDVYFFYFISESLKTCGQEERNYLNLLNNTGNCVKSEPYVESGLIPNNDHYPSHGFTSASHNPLNFSFLTANTTSDLYHRHFISNHGGSKILAPT